MNEIKIEMFRASKGDCFLISLIENADKKHILIDGGFYHTYENHLKNRLRELAVTGDRLSLVVVTHIDSDHIEGILQLLKENQSAQNPQIISIDEIWHNSYRHLQLDQKEELHTLNYKEKILLEDIIIQNNKLGLNTSNENNDISAEQGSSLASLIYKGKYNWNSQFDGMAVSTDNNRTIKLNEEIIVHLLSPNDKKLENLKSYWLGELQKQKYDFKLTNDKLFDDAYEFYLMSERNEIDGDENESISSKMVGKNLNEYLNKRETTDSSPTNGSSISFIIEYKQKKMLFLGDSHPHIIKEELEKLLKGSEEKIFFDLIKISHHGSRRNTHKALLNIIDSNNFLISTNGETHKHPHNETIAQIVCRPTKDVRNLFFNYRQGEKAWDEYSNKDAYNYRVFYPNNEDSIVITCKNEKIEVD